MRALPVFIVIVVAGIGDVFANAANVREPWRWSLEERLTARRAAQIAAAAEHSPGEPPWRIDGSVNPELFTPSELFEGFIDSCFAAGDETFRASRIRAATTDARRFGFPADFVQKVEEDAGPFIDAMRRQYARVGAGLEVDKALSLELCRTRVAALTRIRARFGGERLDEFLYRTEAPGRTFIGVTLPASDSTEQLRERERGCSR